MNDGEGNALVIVVPCVRVMAEILFGSIDDNDWGVFIAIGLQRVLREELKHNDRIHAEGGPVSAVHGIGGLRNDVPVLFPNVGI